MSVASRNSGTVEPIVTQRPGSVSGPREKSSRRKPPVESYWSATDRNADS